MCIRDRYRELHGVTVRTDTPEHFIMAGRPYTIEYHPRNPYTVSYTHLDVYKRQILYKVGFAGFRTKYKI